MRSQWNTERRTSLAGNSLAKQQYPTLPSTDDYSSDDDRPGAFAVEIIADEREAQEDVWDPTEPQEVFDDQSISAKVSSHDSEEAAFDEESIPVTASRYVDETVTTQGQKKKRRCLLLFLAASILCGVVGAVVGVMLGGNKDTSDSSTSDSSSGQETPPSVDECENSTDPYVQCEVCSQPIRVSDAVQDIYNSLKAFDGLAEYLDIDMQIESCAPDNMALVWLASEFAEARGNIFKFYEPIPSRFLLALLYFAWDGRHWSENINWLSSKSECDWHGVSCNENGKIESLSLRSNNMKGSLESRLGLLRDIKTLDLYLNEINGSIPHQLWNLSSLESLNLGGNLISGTLPAVLGESATSLTELYLDQNQLVGTLPSISRLTNLKELSLASNKLNGRIPNDWGDVRQLEILRLDTTRVSGTIPEFIGNMTSLKTLTIEGSLLSGSIPTTVGYLTELVTLITSRASLGGTIPSELGGCTQLEGLILVSNSLVGSLPTELGNLSMLKQLDVKLNRFISGTLPEEYLHLTNLGILRIGGTKIKEPIPSGLCRGGEGQISIFADTDIKCSCCF